MAISKDAAFMALDPPQIRFAFLTFTTGFNAISL